MKDKNILEIIEEKYPVEDILLSCGMPVWPLLRQSIYFEVQRKTVQYSNKLRTRNKLRLLKNFCYGFSNIVSLRKYNYILFNNTDKRRDINNKKYDLFTDGFGDKIGQDQCLFIEWAIEKHHPKNTVHSKNVLGDLPIKFITSLCAVFVKPKISNTTILDEILSELAISINYKKVLKEKYAEFFVYKQLLKYIQPKGIFILSSFTKVAIVKAAKELNIKVYEPQHGYIGASHPFYHAVKKFESFYPDTLFSFGISEKQEKYPSLIFNPEYIIPIGSLQMDIAKKQPVPVDLQKLRTSFSKIFCVTLQSIKDQEILEWIDKETQLHKDWVFIVRSKQPNFNLSLYIKNPQVILMPSVSTYDVLKISDYNITIFSTTVVEGIFFNAKPILYNIDNLPYKYFDLENADIAVVEQGSLVSNEQLNCSGTLPQPYFKSGYFKNVENLDLCF